MRKNTISFILLAGCLQWAVSARAESRPNILLFLSDDHSAPHLGCYGNPDLHTPNLDKFASEGMRFDRAYTTSSQCVPSRASIMTGRSAVRINMTRFSAPLPSQVVTFPELLRKAGYFTGVAGRSYHLDGAHAPKLSAEILQRHHLETFSNRLDYVNVVNIPNTKAVPYNNEVMRQCHEFLDAVPQGRPFFLQLCTSDPHRPFDGTAIPAPRDPSRLKLPPGFPDTPAVRKDLADYYDEISRLDEVFGRMLKALDERGLATNTLVVFMGDNGASQLRGKGTLYELGLHVPLLVRWPGRVRPGQTCEDLISGEDLGPTLLAAAGLSEPEDWSGQSFLPVLLGKPHQIREFVYAERGPHATGLPGNTASFDQGRAVISKTHKLIYNALFEQPYSPVDFQGRPAWKSTQRAAEEGKVPTSLVPLYTGKPRPMFEVYDLVNDPSELNNLAGKPIAAAAEDSLKAAMQEWMILDGDYLPLPVTGGKGKRGSATKADPAVE